MLRALLPTAPTHRYCDIDFDRVITLLWARRDAARRALMEMSGGHSYQIRLSCVSGEGHVAFEVSPDQKNGNAVCLVHRVSNFR